MYCSKCGKELPDNSVFCWSCGAKIEIPESTKVLENSSSAVSIEDADLISKTDSTKEQVDNQNDSIVEMSKDNLAETTIENDQESNIKNQDKIESKKEKSEGIPQQFVSNKSDIENNKKQTKTIAIIALVAAIVLLFLVIVPVASSLINSSKTKNDEQNSNDVIVDSGEKTSEKTPEEANDKENVSKESEQESDVKEPQPNVDIQNKEEPENAQEENSNIFQGGPDKSITVDSKNIENYDRCLDLDNYTIYMSDDVSRFNFAYPVDFFNYYEQKKDLDTDYLSIDGTLIEDDMLESSGSTIVGYTLFRPKKQNGIEGTLNIIEDYYNSYLYDAKKISHSVKDDYGTSVITGYDDTGKNFYQYTFIRVDSEYIYSMSIITKSYKDEEDRLKKSYMTEVLYRWCGFTDATSEPRSYEMFKNEAGIDYGEVFPDSTNRYLTEEEVKALDQTQIRYAINEIYARRGYVFQDKELSDHFSKFSWYEPTVNSMGDIENKFNEFEEANVKLLAKYRNTVENKENTSANNNDDREAVLSRLVEKQGIKYYDKDLYHDYGEYGIYITDFQITNVETNLDYYRIDVQFSGYSDNQENRLSILTFNCFDKDGNWIDAFTASVNRANNFKVNREHVIIEKNTCFIGFETPQ